MDFSINNVCAHPHCPRPTQLSNPGYATGSDPPSQPPHSDGFERRGRQPIATQEPPLTDRLRKRSGGRVVEVDGTAILKSSPVIILTVFAPVRISFKRFFTPTGPCRRRSVRSPRHLRLHGQISYMPETRRLPLFIGRLHLLGSPC